MFDRRKPLTRKKPLGAGKKGLARSGAAAGDTATGTAPNRGVKGRKPEEDSRSLALQALQAFLKDGVRDFVFRADEPLGRFTADFFAPAARLVIAIAPGDDAERAAWFAAEGYRVIAFSPLQVLRDPQTCLDTIAASFTLRVISSPE